MAGSLDDKYYLDGLKNSDAKVFGELFDLYYANLVMFCGNYIRDLHKCEDVVSDVFVALWERRDGITISRSLKSYLLNAVRNKALNEIRHDSVRYKYAERMTHNDILEVYDVDDYILYTDERKLLAKGIEALPEKIREVYVLSRDSGLSSSEIARAMNVTQRTVELRISRALSLLRSCLEY